MCGLPLWLINRIDKIDWDEYTDILVAAKTSKQARNFAGEWEPSFGDAARSTCEKIADHSKYHETRAVISSFKSG